MFGAPAAPSLSFLQVSLCLQDAQTTTCSNCKWKPKVRSQEKWSVEANSQTSTSTWRQISSFWKTLICHSRCRRYYRANLPWTLSQYRKFQLDQYWTGLERRSASKRRRHRTFLCSQTFSRSAHKLIHKSAWVRMMHSITRSWTFCACDINQTYECLSNRKEFLLCNWSYDTGAIIN